MKYKKIGIFIIFAIFLLGGGIYFYILYLGKILTKEPLSKKQYLQTLMRQQFGEKAHIIHWGEVNGDTIPELFAGLKTSDNKLNYEKAFILALPTKKPKTLFFIDKLGIYSPKDSILEGFEEKVGYHIEKPNQLDTIIFSTISQNKRFCVVYNSAKDKYELLP